MDGNASSYIFIVILIAFSAFFSGSEIAFASVNKLRLKKNAESQNKLSYRIALYIAENYDKALSSILVGNNLVNIAASSIATVIAMSIAGEAYVGYATAIMTVVILIFGEIMPKLIAREHSESFTKAVALPLRGIMIITFPVVFVVIKILDVVSKLWGGSAENSSGVTEDELVTIIEMVEDEGVIDEARSDLLQSAIEFSDITAQEIITPRVDMLAIDVDDDTSEIKKLIDNSAFSRLPVYEGTVDNIIGVLYLNRFYKKLIDENDFEIRDMLMEVCYIPKTLKLPYVLAELRRARQHLAVVTDEYGGTLGILTMEDVLEELVGEIWDETDEVVREFTVIDENNFEASGDMSIFDFLEELGADNSAFEGDYTTLGGWITDMLNGFPSEGDSFEYAGMTITVKETDDKRVKRVSVLKHPLQEEDKEQK